MKVVIASLFVFVMMFSFAVAGSSSSIRTDFYIQEPGTSGGYQEDVSDTSSQQNEWLSNVIYWSMVLIAFAILIKVLKMFVGKKSKAVKKKRKTKRSRRKK